MATTAKASRIRLHAIQSYLHALEQEADVALRQEHARAEQALQKRYERAMSKLRLWRLQTRRLQIELRLARNADIGRLGRKGRDGTRRR